MNKTKIAKILGSLGGKSRAKKLSLEKKRKIASLGGKAKAESYELAKRIEANFNYLEAIHELSPPPKVKSLKTCRHKLPGIYE